jgi:hypothetical protein
MLDLFLPLDLGFQLPIQGDPERGAFLVSEGVKRGTPFQSVAFTGMAHPLRVPKDGRPIYDNRLNPDIAWVWRDTPASDVARVEVSKVEHLFHTLTRVTLILPSPRVPLLLHYDPVIGNEYKPGEPFERRGSCVQANKLHAQNKHFCLKLPITERPGDFGIPMLRHDGVTYRYSTEGRFFVINEIDILHGAAPVDHQRGVLWIDGLLNIDQLQHLPGRRPIPLFETDNPVAVEPSCEGGPYDIGRKM